MKSVKNKALSTYRITILKGNLFKTSLILLFTMITSNKAAIYIRVSTVSQNTDLQKDGLVEYAQRAKFSIEKEYVDIAVSGRKEGRPALRQLMKAAYNREFDCVVVWKFDRFARSVSHLLKALEEFNHLGIRFISVQDQIDTNSPMGRAMFTIIGAMAELESSLISERVKAGMAAAKSRGKKIGRPETPLYLITQIEELAATTDLSINKIRTKIKERASRAVVGQIVKRVRDKEIDSKNS
ncbi:MAG: DNA invertase Pin-like site-specific DNA recombinase [Polaribacter sp.]|jgi:DNA invertase Pin-like site-specific DNA recombinase